jgi:ankyrin repeat protein
MKTLSKNLVLLIACLLLSSGLRSQEDKFLTAAAKGDIGKVSSYLKKGVDVNAKNNLKWTALSYAAKFGHLDIVNLLLKHEAKIDYRNNTGFTPLMISYMNNQESIFKYLIDNGADPDVKDMVGMSVLAYAVKDNKLNAVKYLIEQAGADINIKNSSGRTPMDICTDDTLTKYLRTNGAKTGKELISSNE